jgi:hypothetical protein
MRKVAILSLAAILTSASITARAQQSANPNNSPPSCSQPEVKQFDFWVGEWDLEWANGGKGRNVIEKTLGGCVVQENFDGSPASPLRGLSVSSYNAGSRKWQQTWVDNQGGYLDFVGEFKDSKMVLQRSATINGKEVLQRMVWYDITKDGLLWNWERSEDKGKTWTVLWKIKYTRKK